MTNNNKIKLCYNEACTKGSLNVIGDLEYAAAAGFDEIELRFDCVAAFLHNGGKISDLRSAVEHSGLILGPMNALYIYPELLNLDNQNATSVEFNSSLKLLKLLRDEIGISQAITVSPLLEDHTVAQRFSGKQAFEMSVNALNFLCSTMPDVTFIFEPVGLERSLVRDVSFAHEIVNAVDASNVGMVLDSCNLFLKDLKSDFDFSMLPVSEIMAVHLMNGKKPVVSGEILNQTWRRFLDDGDWVNTEKFLDELQKTGYTGMISTEVFCEEYEKKYSQEEIIRWGYRSLKKALKKYKIPHS